MAEAASNNQALAGPATGGKPPAFNNPIDTVMQSHTVRHFGRLIGLAAAIAVGTVVALWTMEPNYTPLYSNVSGQDASEIANVLTANQIEYRIDGDDGAIMVEQGKASEARLKLAAAGLPKGTTKGLEMLQDEQGLGTSQFIESARYNHAVETELARSIESIRSVEQARVHLALPKQSIFIRNRAEPSASVVVKLYAGRRLNQGQVDAIVHLVAASVPMLEVAQVNVVDQFGRLLTSGEDNEMAQTTKQFDYTRKLEESYANRIIQMLQPIVGEGKVNAQVSATLDFSMVESTREAFDPERSVVRSEQVSESAQNDQAQAMGIPGALSNQPPGIGSTDPNTVAADAGMAALPANQNRSATRNYEVDRLISHTRSPRGTIQRMSVAVVIDSRTAVNDQGEVEIIAYTDEEIARFESLVRETIGFDDNRGDRVSIINQSFVASEVELIEPPLWQTLLGETWVWTLVKQVLGAIGLLIVYLVFIRPFLKSLSPMQMEAERQAEEYESGRTDQQPPMVQGAAYADQPLLTDDPNSPFAMIRRSDATHDQKVGMARNLVQDDPARVANVVKHWIAEEK